MLSSKEIRQKWITFFESKNHLKLESKSLIPVDDPSLLWINSGVATLKDYFSGKKTPPSPRIVNSQKSIRTNDIENVGITARHHTFFEMLGNFSIGDYFKKEALAFAKEFVLDVLKLEKEKLYFTYYHEDLETKQIWLDLGFDPSHLIAGSRKTNFWDVGMGPCGPNTEIFYDRGPKYDPRGVELLKEDIENDRYIEIWNIVFSTFNNDGKNNYSELKLKNIDTGAGFERIVSILQNAPTNYDTDLFLPIIRAIEKLTNKKYVVENYFQNEPVQREINTYFKIIADHMRSVANAIGDGAGVSNVGRDYIIRRLIRRAYRTGIQLGIKDEAFLYKLVPVIKDSLIFDYDTKHVAKVIKDEELLFSKTIDQGKKILEKEFEKSKKIDASIVFKMFDTYGYPVELTKEMAKEKGVEISLEEFEKYRQEHELKSKSKKGDGMKKVINFLANIDKKVDEFVGYDTLETTSKILYLFNSESKLNKLEGQGYFILDKTPFYATSGGQKHDQGYVEQDGKKFKILEVFKDKNWNHVHLVKGEIDSSKELKCVVDAKNRKNLERNHSATHLLFKVLRDQIGPFVVQLGSNNNEKRLTFDFPSQNKPSKEKIKEIEKQVRKIIELSIDRQYSNETIDKAKEMGAIITIEETEYMDPTNVRIVTFKNITSDLCGGTHIPNTKLIENFKIISVENKGTGIFRISAITTEKLVRAFNQEHLDNLIEQQQNIIKKIQKINPSFKYKNQFKSDDLEQRQVEVEESILALQQEFKKALKSQENVEINFENLEFENIANYKVYINLEADKNTIKAQGAQLREKFDDLLIILASVEKNSTILTIASKKYDSNKIFNLLKSEYSLKGGGNAILVQGFTSDKITKDKILKVLNG
ncbi:alanine--tRNA ligase [Mycoplasmopsis pulmonis]|uniref:alanine--tRNA ligase n=1 Tax=Mycoplasmopsis pulmonis TaxID=2107 RepID=UPI001004E727|nr:alanine--tRNA ligase [Mycoplasmopsis pulmonis]MDZ7293639.1 alanine--tRNA ligase [Mycoplasmopsis pulmonis]VEU68322.1 Alanine--tRNA ligase [Mycoplasmopsis pulmonis]